MSQDCDIIATLSVATISQPCGSRYTDNIIRTVNIDGTIKKLGTTVDEVAESGPGLVFIAYPKALRLKSYWLANQN